MKTKLEKEIEILKPRHASRKKIEDIKEKRDLDDYYGELMREMKE